MRLKETYFQEDLYGGFTFDIRVPKDSSTHRFELLFFMLSHVFLLFLRLLCPFSPFL